VRAPAELLDALRARSSAMLESVEALVRIESPSTDRSATAACADELAALGHELLGARPQRVDVEGCPHLRWSFGERTRVVLLGHLDTVWPLGTLARWPFSVQGDIATGPGAFDMKAGLVQGLYALAMQDDLDGVTVLVTGDEELGSPTSRPLVEDTARDAEAVLVLEPSARGALKTVRKGVSLYRIETSGRAAHAGLEPEEGVNALVELAHQVLAVVDLARPEIGTTVSPTVLTAGTTSNVIPARGTLTVDVRVASSAEQERVDEGIRALSAITPDASVTVSGGPNRPPLSEGASTALLIEARRLAAALALPPLETATVGGASDGNFTAGLGVPTLDGLGAVGDGAHAEGEHIVVAAMPERAALVAALVADLLAKPLQPTG
jgi:glutamate carboxypeptidase